MFGGKARTPLVIRTMIGAGCSAAAQHSQSALLDLDVDPGLKMVLPSNASDAKGLLIEAIRDDDPVIFCEHKAAVRHEGRSARRGLHDSLWRGQHLREGDDVTIVAWRGWCTTARGGRQSCRRTELSVDVIDPRTTSPLDEEAILESVEQTGRLVVVDESPPRCEHGH